MGAQDSLRLGVVGLGNIGETHCKLLLGGAITRAKLTAVASPSISADQATRLGVPHFSDDQELIRSGLVDAVLVATPTYSHVEVGQHALQAGLHLLMEKPLAMSVAQATSLLEMQSAKVKFAVMLNQRFHPHYQEIHRLVHGGAIGPITRVAWMMTAWYRPDIYYQVSKWRGTWPGEGGGLLINQCIHNLDVLQWITGMPSSVTATAGFGKHHKIEVEDEVTAMLSYPNGASGVLVASSGEAPGVNQLDLVGEQGMLRFDGNGLQLWRAEQNVREHSESTADMFGMPEFALSQPAVDNPQGPNDQHIQVIQNFVDAILDDAPLLTAAAQGLASLELANSLLLSAWTRESVSLPMNSVAYENFLQDRMGAGQLRKPSGQPAKIDMDASYR